jgi:hypothetical protein
MQLPAFLSDVIERVRYALFGAGPWCEHGNVSVPLAVYSKVPHIRQTQAWDCGIACAQMILSAIGCDDANGSAARESIVTKSVWSIDIALFLFRKGARLLFFTQSIGVRRALKDIEYYTEDWSGDESRVTGLFEAAKQEGMAMYRASLRISQLHLLASLPDCAIIVLADSQMLLSHGSSPSCGTAYRGHYLILVGSSTTDAGNYNSSGFFVCDPGVIDSLTFVPEKILDEARLAQGTDEDIIIVDLLASRHDGELRPAIRHILGLASG